MIRRGIAMLVGGLGAAGASQAPEFAQQYAQRLGGAVDELRAVVRDFEADAAREGLTRESGLQRLEGSPDTFVTRRGRSQRETIDRFERLQAVQDEMEKGDALSRVMAMAKGYDAEIASRAMTIFRPAMPLTIEGLVFALIGFVAGLLLGGLGALPFARRPAAKAYPARR